jgi:hypothetical protein
VPVARERREHIPGRLVLRSNKVPIDGVERRCDPRDVAAVDRVRPRLALGRFPQRLEESAEDGPVVEDRFTGLLTIDELDERLTIYDDNDGWRRFTLPKLQAMGSRKVAEAVGISERRARDVLKGRAMPHAKHRLQLEEFSRRS